ncbi:MAG: 50S ribosomal protein L25/general stress protein Ctc [Dichotomicrobium sp.]
MAEISELSAEPRDTAGSAAARAIRKNGGVPAIVYGGRGGPEKLTLNYKEVWKQVETGHFLSTVYMLNINGKKTRVLPKDVQFDPVRDFVEHVDFMRLAKDAVVEVEVAVHVINEDDSPGLERGGVLNFVRHTIELSCPADSIPEYVEIDVSGLDIGDSLHISEVTLPDRVTPTITDRDFTILTIVGASPVEPEAEEGEPEAEEEGEPAEEQAESESDEQ